MPRRRRARAGLDRAIGHADSARPDAAAGPEILREAWRNLASGTTRGLLAAAVFLVVAGGIAVVEARAVVDLAQRAVTFRASGAAVSVVSLYGSIDGAQCDALASAPGVAASGALRAGPPMTLAAFPSRTFETYEATPGLASVLGVVSAAPGASGVWISRGVADSLGLEGGSVNLALLPGGNAPLGGVFPYPSDGRDPLLGYAIVAPIAASGLFDACWVEAWPDAASASDVLYLPVVRNQGNAGDGPTPGAEVRQLNTTLGARFAATSTLGTLPGWAPTSAAAFASFALGFLLVRLRRLELAAAMHAGLSRSTLVTQVLLESAGWLLPAISLATPGLILASSSGNPGGAWAAYFPAARTVALACLSVLAGTACGVVATRERHLFRYFKAR